MLKRHGGGWSPVRHTQTNKFLCEYPTKLSETLDSWAVFIRFCVTGDASFKTGCPDETPVGAPPGETQKSLGP